MTLFNLSRLAGRAIWRNRLRSFLTVLGVVIGVGAVVAIVGIGEGARSAVQEQIASLGDNVVMIFGAHSQRGGVRGASGSVQSLTYEDVEAIRSECPAVSAASPMVRVGAQVINGNRNWATNGQGVSPSYFDIRSMTVASGRRFNDAEDRAGAKVCLLGKTVVDNIFPEEDPVGAVIRFRNIPFRIIGVLESKGQTSWGQDQDDTVVIPYFTARRSLLGSDDIHMIVLSARSRDLVDAAIDQVTTLLRARHRLPPGDEDDFHVRSQTEIASTANEMTGVMTTLLGSIAAVSLLVGGIGIMNIMLVSVTERTREIGIRMAVGAKGRHILLQFLVEAVVLSLFGGLIGVGVGWGICRLVSTLAGWKTLVAPETVALALGFATLVGVFFGFYPARKAARLDPIQALRYE